MEREEPPELAPAPERDAELAHRIATIERRFADARRSEALDLGPVWRVPTSAWQQPLVLWGAPTAAFAVLAGIAAPGKSGLFLMLLAALLALVVATVATWSALRVRRVRAEGVCVPAIVLQAHDSLWEAGADVGPAHVAQVLFSFDERVRRAPRRLAELAEELRARVHASDPLLPAALRRKVEAGAVDYRRRAIPTELTGGALCYLADVTLRRDRLPAGHLDRSLLFCAAHPELARAGVELLPFEVWWRADENETTLL